MRRNAIQTSVMLVIQLLPLLVLVAEETSLLGGAVRRITANCMTGSFTRWFHLRHTGSMYSAESCSSTPPQRGLTLVAAGMLSLLAVAIGNSWAITVDVVSTPRGQRNSKEPTTKRIGT
jgi:hypothetical protein